MQEQPSVPSRRMGPIGNGASGFLMGLDSIGECFALASLCFAGPLAAGLSFGVSAFLLASVITALMMARFSGFAGAIGMAQDSSVAVLAAAMALAATQALASGGPDAALATGLAVLVVSTLGTGVALWLLGRGGLTRYARLLPFPVACGFLATCGFLLVTSAFELVMGQDTASLDQAQGALPILVPAVILALVLLWSSRKLENALAFVGTLIVAVALFWLVQGAQDAPPEGRMEGLINLGQLSRFELGEGQGVSLALLGHIDTQALLAAGVGIGAVILLNVLSAVLNMTTLEIDSGRSLDLDHEALLAGRANLIVGVFGGISSYLDGPATALNYSLGLKQRAVAYGQALAAFVGLLFAGSVIPYVPVFVSTGLLLFIGCNLLLDWLWAVRRQIDRMEWAIVIGVVLAAAFFGIVIAIGIGILLSAVSFAVAYARSPLVRRRWNGVQVRSIWDRAPAAESYLMQNGPSIRGIALQGRIYFGRIETLNDELRQIDWPVSGPRILILDFTEVSGLDGAACAALQRMFLQMVETGIVLHLAGLNPDSLRAMRRWSESFGTDPRMHLHDDLDTALEAAETALLAHAPLEVTEEGVIDIPADLAPLFETHDVKTGETLIHAGQAGAEAWLLVAGRLGVYVAGAGGRKRVRSLAPGALVGEVALLTGGLRTADVIADADSRVLRLSDQVLRGLEKSDPARAFEVHRWLARAISDKLVRANARL